VSDPLFVQPDGVRSCAQIHDGVVAGLSQLISAAAPEAAGVQTSHGAIASAVSAALSSVLGDRQGTMQATSKTGSTISGLLQKAAEMYEHGDQKGAATLTAAAEALEGPQGSGAAPGTAASGGGDMAGQMVSQLGQMAQPLQGIAQGLQQVSQQLTQGAEQLAQRGAGAAPTGIPPTTGPGRPPGQGPTSNDKPDRGQDDQKQRAPEVCPDPEKPFGAAAGEASGTGRAPETPQAGRPQTRPQSD